MSYTPGPWTAEDRGNIGFNGEHEYWINFAPFSSLATVRRGAEDEEYGDDETLRANANLIAAAPDMLEVILSFGRAATDVFEQMLNGKWTDDHGHDVQLNAAMISLKDAVEDAMEVLKKARGES